MFFKGISLALFGIGVFLLMQVVSPLLAFKAWEVFSYDQSQLLADPQSANGQSGGGDILGVSINNINNFPAFVNSQKFDKPPYQEFKITVSKLNLENVTVMVYSNDFEKNLAQLPGTALPGEKGNVFISGHSSIAREFELKGSKAFFVNLQKLKKGDEILADALGQRYNYEVIGSKIVDPKDVGVINPPDREGRYLTLMTCVPPGFNTKRLIVLAKLK